MYYTPDVIQEKIETSQKWLEHGVLAIYDHQTSYEQQTEMTRDNNKVGFNAFDAGYLSYVAEWLQSGKHLSGKHLDKTRKKMKKYCAQLARIANGEQEKPN